LAKKPVIKPYNSGQWTQARYNSFVKSALRKASIKWPPKYQVLKEASVGRKINKLTGRMAEHKRCAYCRAHFPVKLVSVDHILPIVDPATGFTNWDDTIERMFCEKDGLQVLCKDCHDKKTNTEKEIAYERKRNAK
jgi:5-methylcytosine-specific restriction endonuclease McrA